MTNAHTAPGLFISIPVLNEIENVEALLSGIGEVLGSRCDYTILFTDDGSVDGTVEYLRQAMQKDPRVRLLQRTKTWRGCQRGGALFEAMVWGLANTRHSVFIEMDGDLSHQPVEILQGIDTLARPGVDFVIASKYLPQSQTVKRPLSRRAVSAVCNVAVRALISRKVTDYSNGFRFYSRDVAATLARHRFRYTSPIYLTEALAICLRERYVVAEFPSIYIGRFEGLSKLRPIDLIKGSLAIFEIAFRFRGPGFRPARGGPE